MDRASIPLISVGIPTYNRPDGLRRTLSCLSQQTYSHLEIIVSDNCSPGTGTADVIAQMATQDPRIVYIRQDAQLGAAGNFRFVLRKAKGEFFMWAADDDEWKPTFVERCYNALKDGAASAMTGFEISYRADGTREPGLMPALDRSQSTASNIHAFLSRLTPSLFYGLHRRSLIGFILNDEFFDYYDCYFILRLIANGGIALVPERLYVAGIDAPEYVVKTATQSWGSSLQYLPFYRATRRLIADANLGFFERLKLEVKLAALVTKISLVNESRAFIRGLKREEVKNPDAK